MKMTEGQEPHDPALTKKNSKIVMLLKKPSSTKRIKRQKMRLQQRLQRRVQRQLKSQSLRKFLATITLRTKPIGGRRKNPTTKNLIKLQRS